MKKIFDCIVLQNAFNTQSCIFILFQAIDDLCQIVRDGGI